MSKHLRPNPTANGVFERPHTDDVSAPLIPSSRLFGAGREIVIRHEAADYRLRITSNGKLLLTK